MAQVEDAAMGAEVPAGLRTLLGLESGTPERDGECRHKVFLVQGAHDVDVEALDACEGRGMDTSAEGFTTLSIIDVRSDRWFCPDARVLGIRDGFLFVEDTEPSDDKQSTTHQALLQSGNVDATGRLVG